MIFILISKGGVWRWEEDERILTMCPNSGLCYLGPEISLSDIKCSAIDILDII
jgi:hypothetical protein